MMTPREPYDRIQDLFENEKAHRNTEQGQEHQPSRATKWSRQSCATTTAATVMETNTAIGAATSTGSTSASKGAINASSRTPT